VVKIKSDSVHPEWDEKEGGGGEVRGCIWYYSKMESNEERCSGSNKALSVNWRQSIRSTPVAVTGRTFAGDTILRNEIESVWEGERREEGGFTKRAKQL
jgi:hypothetical protein